MEQVGRWWNGTWGRLARRDIWLLREVRWRVLAREGDSDTGRELAWAYADEASARAAVQKLMDAASPGDWREISVDARSRRP